MDRGDLTLGSYFTRELADGSTGGVFKLESFCLEPTCTLLNLETGEKEHFGIGGLTARSFKRLVAKG